jgi:subtilisin family serine protease
MTYASWLTGARGDKSSSTRRSRSFVPTAFCVFCTLLLLSFSQPFLSIPESDAFEAGPAGLQDPAGSKPDHSHDRLLVKFKDRDKANAVASKHAAKVTRSYDKLGIHLLKLPPGLSAEEAMKIFSSDPAVQYASLDYLVQADLLPNDPRFGELWGLHNTGQSGGTADADIDAPEAWEISTGSSGIVVGVIDTGVDYNHEDLAANIWRNTGETPGNGIDDDGNGYVDDIYGIDAYNGDSDPMDDHNHGTHVAGTIGAVGGNGIGVVGVNWQVRIMALKFLGAGGSGSTSGAIECINYAVTMAARGVNIRVLSNSWGGGGFSAALRDAIQTAANSGILFVAAAGNDAANNDATPHYPSSYDLPNVLAVASTDRYDQRSSFSSYGLSTVDVAAPGSSVLSTTRDNKYAIFSGTSMATPHVSGIAALILASNPTMSWQALRKLILFSSDSIPSLSGLVLTGGRVNANNALRQSGTSLRIFRTMTTFSVSTGETLRLEAMAGLYADPVPGINVVATFSNGSPSLALRDDGVAPDTVADDGMFAGSWIAGEVGSVVITFVASAPGLSSATTAVSGGVTYPYRIERPSYSWIEISSSETPLELGDDSIAIANLPMAVHFGGQSFTSLTVGSNGFVSLSGQDAGYSNAPMPVTGLSAFLAVFWDDLIGKPTTTQGTVYWHVIGNAPTRQVVVEWKDYAHYDYPSHAGSVTFEAVLYEDSESILMQYQRTSFGDTRFDGGASATIGIQMGSSSAAQYGYNTLNAVTDGTAILYTNAAIRVTVTMVSTSYGTTTRTVTSYTSSTTTTSTIPTLTTVVLVQSTVTSTIQSIQYLTSLITTTLNSYTDTQTLTSVIPTVATVALVPLTMASTAQGTQYLTSIRTTTVTSYTGTETSMIPTITTVALLPQTMTSTAQSAQPLTSTTTRTVTSYTATTTSTSTSVVYTTVTTLASAEASNPLAYLGFLSLLAVTVATVTTRKEQRIQKARSGVERRWSKS